MTQVKEQTIKIICSDGYELTGTLFQPVKPLRAAVMFGPATGIKRGFYSGLANHLANHGYGAISFDNRGIGDSLTGTVKQSTASLVDWGELDMTAVLDALKMHFPNTKYHLIGHSAGGQLVGLMKNAKDLHSQFNFACSSGQMKLMKFPYVLMARFFMHVFMPLSNLVFGYAKNNLFGMGEPLPKRVAQQWTEWCAGQGYVKTAFGQDVKEHLYDEISFPTKWVIASDDSIANEATLEDMISVMPKITVEKIILVPSKLGKREIGHMKFFSRKNQDLWTLVSDWLDRHS